MNYVEQYKISKKNLEDIQNIMSKIVVGSKLLYDEFDGVYLSVIVSEIIDAENGDFYGYFERTDKKIGQITKFNILDPSLRNCNKKNCGG